MPARIRRADLRFFTEITPGKTKEFNASRVKIHGVFRSARIVGIKSGAIRGVVARSQKHAQRLESRRISDGFRINRHKVFLRMTRPIDFRTMSRHDHFPLDAGVSQALRLLTNGCGKQPRCRPTTCETMRTASTSIQHSKKRIGIAIKTRRRPPPKKQADAARFCSSSKAIVAVFEKDCMSEPIRSIQILRSRRSIERSKPRESVFIHVWGPAINGAFDTIATGIVG